MTLSEAEAGSDSPSGVRPRLARPTERGPALRLILSGDPDLGRTRARRFLRDLEARAARLRLWVAEGPAGLCAGAAVAATQGRAGLLFHSPLAGQTDPESLASLVDAVGRGTSPAEASLLQTLSSPDRRRERGVLAEAGFFHLARLVSMEKPISPRRRPRLSRGPSLGLGASERRLPFREAHRAAFERAILASYEDTQDCPALVGLRSIDDVIAGHMASGQGFDARFWFAFFHGTDPVGVLLMNPAERRAIELVYLGLAPPWRRRGLGTKLLDHALAIAADAGFAAIRLAVDANNTPARRLYHDAGFRPVGHREAMIRPLTEPAR